MTPSTPLSRAMRTSSRSSMPFTRRRPFHCAASARRAATRACRAGRARAPRCRETSGTRWPMFSMCGMPCRHQRAQEHAEQPARADDAVPGEPQRGPQRRAVAVAHVVLAVGRHLHVHGQHQRVEAGARGALDEPRDGPGVARQIGLEPRGRPAARTSSSVVSEAPLMIIGMLASAATRASTTSPW